MPPKLKRMARALLPLTVLALLGAGGFGLLFGDGCGPVERGLRAALGTWDMWQSPAVMPHEKPLLAVPAGTVTVGAPASEFSAAQISLEQLPAPRHRADAQVAYRRFCHHCHGPHGDGRIIVGESFDIELPDLRTEDIQELEDEDLFDIVTEGNGQMIALQHTIRPVDRILAIIHLRRLKDAPSHPFFPPRWQKPAQDPPRP